MRGGGERGRGEPPSQSYAHGVPVVQAHQHLIDRRSWSRCTGRAASAGLAATAAKPGGAREFGGGGGDKTLSLFLSLARSLGLRGASMIDGVFVVLRLMVVIVVCGTERARGESARTRRQAPAGWSAALSSHCLLPPLRRRLATPHNPKSQSQSHTRASTTSQRT